MLNNIISVAPKEDQAQACLAALFLTNPLDDREQLIQAKGSRVDGTCEWIKSNELYDSWLRSRSQLLWLSGGPGKGKTMLSIFLAEELEQTAERTQDKLFLQYFCDNRDEKRRTAVSIIRGLMFQLLQSCQKLFDHILPSFKLQKDSLFTDSSFETLWRIFESMVRDPIIGTAYCVLDGLDECDEVSSEVLLNKFAALLSTKTDRLSACHLNLIIISRELPDFIPELLSSFPHICLDPDADTEVNDDIQLFIKNKVDYLATRKHYPEPLRVRVEEVFQNRAQGTFLWIGIVAKVLEKHKAIDDVEKALDDFPPGLDKLYARMLLQIGIGRREIAAKIFCWVVMAVRPLTLSELSIAIETTIRPSAILSRDEVVRDQVLNCGYFLAIERNRVGLIHQSAKDYLLRKTSDPDPKLEYFRVKEEAANLEITRKCLNYLQQGALSAGEVDLERDTPHLEAFPLLSYAVLYWPEHARSLSRSEDIFDLSLPFYHKKSQVRQSWLRTYWAVKKHEEPPNSFTLLHLASFTGILPIAENLLSKNGLIDHVKRFFYLNKTDDRGNTALILAAEGGYEAVVRLLLEKGAHVNTFTKAEFNQTALHIAADSGYEAVVRLLLENGADVKAKSKFREVTALYMAAQGGYEAVVQLLLEKGADVNAKENFREQTALHQAASGGYEAVAWLLLKKGADIKAKTHYTEETSLYMAAKGGHEAVVQLLLEKGADVNAKNKYRETALHVAAHDGYEGVVWLLLEKGADVKAKTGFTEETSLYMAAEGGHEAVVQLLLEKGADVNATNIYGETALYVAVKGGYEAVARLLLEEGADVNAKDGLKPTALHMATMGGYETVVQQLLEKGADINATNIYGETALHMAAWGGYEAVVRLLLEKGANINTKRDNGETALHEAAWGGHKAVVQLLLEKGANVNAKEDNGETALHLAAMRGHEAVVRLLLEKGADVNVKDGHDRTALHVAAVGGHEALVQLLTPVS